MAAVDSPALSCARVAAPVGARGAGAPRRHLTMGKPATPQRFTAQVLNPKTLYNGQVPSTPVSRGTMPM